MFPYRARGHWVAEDGRLCRDGSERRSSEGRGSNLAIRRIYAGRPSLQLNMSRVAQRTECHLPDCIDRNGLHDGTD